MNKVVQISDNYNYNYTSSSHKTRQTMGSQNLRNMVLNFLRFFTDAKICHRPTILRLFNSVQKYCSKIRYLFGVLS